MRQLVILLALFQGQKLTMADPQAHPSPEILRMVETHCVAVLTTEAVMRVSPYPEQMLKLRCK